MVIFIDHNLQPEPTIKGLKFNKTFIEYNFISFKTNQRKLNETIFVYK